MMPFTFTEAAANLITNEELDPEAKIPEFKFCAVKLAPGSRDDDKAPATCPSLKNKNKPKKINLYG